METESLFSRQPDGTFNYPDKSSRNTRQAARRFTEGVKIPSEVPLTATPCTVVQQGQFLLFQGTARMLLLTHNTTAPSAFTSLQACMASLLSNARVFDCVQFHGSSESLAQSIREGTCSCVTDGTYKDQHGTAAWKIIDLDKPKHSIKGQVVTPGFPYQQDSYRSELSGLCASVTAINALILYHGLLEGSIMLACDNISAIRMTSYDPLGTNPSLCAQYDLVMAIQQIKSPILSWVHKHVKGHQDDHPDLTLSPLELKNVEMDTKAKSHWTLMHIMMDADRLHDFDGQPWVISLGGKKVISNLSMVCKDTCQRPRIHAYWIKKGRFLPETINHVEFQMAGWH
jgi:hypothetical protein